LLARFVEKVASAELDKNERVTDHDDHLSDNSDDHDGSCEERVFKGRVSFGANEGE